MKRERLIIMVSVLVLLAVNAYGATLNYFPNSISVYVEPGNASVVPLTITMDSAQGSDFSLTVIAGMNNETLPQSWVEPLDPVVPITPGFPAISMLIVTVPKSTSPGTYQGHLFSMVTGGEEPVNQGGGVALSVTVPTVTSECEEKPVFNDTSIGPDVIDVPDNKPFDVQVAGTVKAPEGCTITRVRYHIEDEYGENSGADITFKANGGFSTKIPINASRRGSDKDGRLYKLTLFAENEAGEGESGAFLIRVSHDRRDK